MSDQISNKLKIYQKAVNMVSPEEIRVSTPRIVKHQTMRCYVSAESPVRKNYYLRNLYHP